MELWSYNVSPTHVQAFSMTKKKQIKHDKHCLGTQEERVVLWSCISTSTDQQWEHTQQGLLKHM